MTYQTGTCTSVADFADKLAIFAAANTSMVDAGTFNVTLADLSGDPSGVVRVLSLSNGVNPTVYFCLASGGIVNVSPSNGSGINLLGDMKYALPTESMNYTRTNPVGQTYSSYMTSYDAPNTFSSTYHFISVGECVHGVLEVFQNVFTHISFGRIAKAGIWDGGEYICAYGADRKVSGLYSFQNANNYGYLFEDQASPAVNWGCGFVRNNLGRADNGDFSPLSTGGLGVGESSAAQARMAINESFSDGDLDGTGYYYDRIFNRGSNSFNNRAVLLPIEVRFNDVTTSSTVMFDCGYVEGVRLVNMEGLEPKHIVDGEWIIFPLAQKGGDRAVAPDSGKIGLAYYIG